MISIAITKSRFFSEKNMNNLYKNVDIMKNVQNEF